MAAYDADERKVVVRVVYDGPGFAGKTTNLKKLESFFTARRRSDVESPGERGGRTTIFDWMHLDGGLVAGHALRCQLVTVPGQWTLQARRLHLLSTADVVVFVCEATPAGLDAARPQLDSLREHLAARAPEEVPLVLQLNKQDLPDAVESSASRERLAVSSSLPTVMARARDGVGVRETVVLAIREAANRVQQLLLRDGLDALQALERRDELRDRLEALPPGADDDGLAEGSRDSEGEGRSLAIDGVPEDDGSGLELRLARPAGARPGRLPRSAPIAEPADAARSAPPPRAEVASRSRPRPASASPEGSERPSASGGPGPTVPPASTSTETSDTARVPDPEDFAAPPSHGSRSPAGGSLPPERTTVRPRPETRAVPPWPDANASSGCIWPATTGREILRAVGSVGPPKKRRDLVARQGMDDGSGGSDLELFQAGAWCLKTSRRRRFDDPDRARAELLRLARAKVQLGPLLPPDTVLSLASAPRQGTWLWTVTPWMQTSRAALSRAAEASEDALGEELVAFAEAALAALELTVRRGAVLDVHPSNFARHRGALVYIDDDIEPGRRAPGMGHALLQRAQEYADHPRAVERYLAHLEVELPRRFARVELEDVGLVESLVPHTPRSGRAREAKTRLLGAIQRRRGVSGKA